MRWHHNITTYIQIEVIFFFNTNNIIVHGMNMVLYSQRTLYKVLEKIHIYADSLGAVSLQCLLLWWSLCSFECNRIQYILQHMNMFYLNWISYSINKNISMKVYPYNIHTYVFVAKLTYAWLCMFVCVLENTYIDNIPCIFWWNGKE